MQKSTLSTITTLSRPDILPENGPLLKSVESTITVSVNNLKVTAIVTAEVPEEAAKIAGYRLNSNLEEFAKATLSTLDDLHSDCMDEKFDAEKALKQLPAYQYKAVEALILARQNTALQA